MADQQAKFVLTLEGKDDQLTSLFAAFKRQVRSDVSEIEKLTANVKLFGTLDADVKKAAQELDRARTSVAVLARTMETLRAAGEPVGRDLTAAFNNAQRAAAAAEKSFVSQSKELDKLRTSLVAAEVDVNDLTAAEQKLAVAAKAAAAAAVEQAAKQTTGFKTLRDIAPEVAKINAAYSSLASSGKLSFGELSTLHARAQQQVQRLRDEVGGVGAAFREVRGTIIGFAAAFGGIVAAGAKSSENFRQFSTQIAAVGTIADVSAGRLKELEDGVRKLSREMGVDAVNSAQALYDILGSGISPDNALTVLAQSTQAARAGLTDVKTAAAAGVAVLNGYGLQVSQLEHVFDVMFQTVRDGVITFPELAKNIGNVIPVARAANVPLEEIGAAFATLTKGGIDAPEAATAIARAITELAAPAPEAAQRMRELGIEFRGLLGTVEQFADKNFSLDQISQLIPETRAAKAVLSLAQNFRFLADQVKLATTSAGQMREAYARMADTPQAKVDRFNASIKDLSLSVGEFVTSATPFIERITAVTNAFNSLPGKTKQTTIEIVALTAALAGALIVLRQLAVPLNLLAGALASLGPAAVVSAQGLTATTAAIGALQLAIAGLLGFRLGEILYEWAAPVRVLGDVLGAMLASVDNLARAIGGGLYNALTLNVAGLKETWNQFRRNNQIIAEDYVNAVTLASEKNRELAASKTAVISKLGEMSKAAATAAGEVSNSVGALIAKLDTEAKAIEASLTTTQSKLNGLTASLAKGVDDIGNAASSAIANLAAQTSQKLAALKTIDVQRAIDTVKIEKQAAEDRISILKKFAEDSIGAFNAEAEARRRVAEKSLGDAKTAGEALKRVDQEIAQARAANLQGIVNAFRAHVDELLKIERGHLDKVRELEEQRRGINQDADEKIREIRRGTLSEYEKYADRVREIDEFISKSRQALAAGDNKRAEEFAQKAINAASSIAQAVKDGSEEVVSGSQAQSNAISAITRAQGLLNESLKQRTQAEKDGAEAAAAGLRETLPLLEQYEQKLKDVRAQAAEGIKLRAELDISGVEKQVAELTAQLEQRAIVVPILANLRQANEDIQKAKNDLEKGIPVPLVAKTEALTEAVKAVQEARPQLVVETSESLKRLDDLRAKAKALEEERPKIEAVITSNVADVQRDIDKLKEPTSSTHTVKVKYENADGSPAPAPSGGGSGSGTSTPGFARGGYVRRVKRYARGGAVFAGGGKVPGTGNGDTVPAMLRSGMYVVRKAASRFYGDGLMGKLARFAGGGQVTKEDAEKWAALLPLFGGSNPFGVTLPKNGKSSTPDSFQSNEPPVNFDSRPIPEALLTAINVLAYAREMLNAVGSNNPLLGSLKPAILDGIAAVERRPGDKDALVNLLRAAETIGANPYIFDMWGKTASSASSGKPLWFVDWLMQRGFDVGGGAGGKGFALPDLAGFAKTLLGSAAAATGQPKNILTGGGLRNVVRRFADGGSTDTVPAMLTPGEQVMNRGAVARFGTRFFDAINRMAVPREALARMLAGPAVPVAHFATGGYVGEPGAPRMATRGTPPIGGRDGGPVFNLYTEQFTEDFIRRKVIPVLDDVNRRKGKG